MSTKNYNWLVYLASSVILLSTSCLVNASHDRHRGEPIEQHSRHHSVEAVVRVPHGQHGHYMHQGKRYKYSHNGRYYNYLHNNNYYVYFHKGAYYNYFYKGRYYNHCIQVAGKPAIRVCH